MTSSFTTPAPLCAELDAILRNELRLGNAVQEGSVRAQWPSEDSVFAALRDDLHLSAIALPPHIKHTVCTDPHYGWHDECFCERHRHLLVAGQTKLPKA
ncbi:hypothetical protein DIE07_11735 [Burkholderia sp. Bp9002]|nr:hypothetical protein DIE07_11735 [Burkholderia sp. Bp9002]